MSENGNRDDSFVWREKTRNLPVYDYLRQLQKEYIVAELRKKIYPGYKDKAYYTRVMEGKEQKIEDIATRNSLPTIFTDRDLRTEIYHLVYREKGYPNFSYRDELEAESLVDLDRYYYYMNNSQVKFFIKDKMKIGTIISVDFLKDEVVVSCSEDSHTYKLNLQDDNLTRIL